MFHTRALCASHYNMTFFVQLSSSCFVIRDGRERGDCNVLIIVFVNLLIEHLKFAICCAGRIYAEQACQTCMCLLTELNS